MILLVSLALALAFALGVAAGVYVTLLAIRKSLCVVTLQAASMIVDEEDVCQN